MKNYKIVDINSKERCVTFTFKDVGINIYLNKKGNFKKATKWEKGITIDLKNEHIPNYLITKTQQTLNI